jgi:predicted HTH transcriptional regulator
MSQDIEKLARLRLLIDEVARDITVNRPPSTLKMQKVDDALNVFGKLTAEDRILALVRGGESKTVEFKQTFSVPRGDDLTVSTKVIEKATIKNIAAFLNTDGGVVLVGVHDDGRILGIEEEIKSKHTGSRDAFLQYVRSTFSNAVTTKNPGLKKHMHLINYDIVEVQGKLVLQIECPPSPVRVFFEEKFFVRQNPAVVALDGEDLLNYVEHRFKVSPPAVLG